MSDSIQIISPIDGSIYAERPSATPTQIDATLAAAVQAQAAWADTPLSDRAKLVLAALSMIDGQCDAVAEELAWQMGRPIRYGGGEIGGFMERGEHMVAIAEESLRPVTPAPKDGFDRYIERRPLGVVFVIAAWNYPYLIAVNSIVPALMAGNSVVLKHSGQTLLSGERIVAAFKAAGAPEGLISILHMGHDDTAKVIGDARIAHVNFTGSVSGGHAIVQAAQGRFIGLGLELGGKDPAYVRADADLDSAAEALVDGSFFNSGQSCCGIERIYVAQSVYDAFIDRMVASTDNYVLGSPLDADTTIGPMVRISAADGVRAQVNAALAAGATALIDENRFAASKAGTPYLAPQILTDVTHDMAVMREETFGPVVGIMPVANDDMAVQLMNDSPYGLTASVWTQDADAARAIGARVQTGTFFMNRCDYLDPGLAWTGIGDTGRGASLSKIGYEQLTRPMSFHLKTEA
jgi:acyl-CoA reductase-like NAD-dependent aldehyde dehydrogenase